MGATAGRGRLSGIELLPEECSPIIGWAAEELRDRDRTQTDIYVEFVKKLEELKAEYHGELEFTVPSFSAFNRHAIKLAVLSRRLDQTREIAGTLAEKFDAASSDNLTVIAAEAIKTLVFELLTAGGEAGVDPKGAMALANALRAASQAQSVSSERRRKLDKEFDAGAEAAVDAVVKAGAKVDREEVLLAIRQAYGVAS